MPQTYIQTTKDLRRYIWDAMKCPGACRDGGSDSLSRRSGSVKPTSASTVLAAAKEMEADKLVGSGREWMVVVSA